MIEAAMKFCREKEVSPVDARDFAEMLTEFAGQQVAAAVAEERRELIEDLTDEIVPIEGHNSSMSGQGIGWNDAIRHVIWVLKGEEIGGTDGTDGD